MLINQTGYNIFLQKYKLFCFSLQRQEIAFVTDKVRIFGHKKLLAKNGSCWDLQQ